MSSSPALRRCARAPGGSGPIYSRERKRERESLVRERDPLSIIGRSRLLSDNSHRVYSTRATVVVVVVVVVGRANVFAVLILLRVAAEYIYVR